jgi:LruC domain-containing protein
MKTEMKTTLMAWTVGLAVGLGGPAALAQDSDGDGVQDAIDVAPCDNTIASMTFYPADRTYGMMMFEDNWPKKGDFDFNDVVVAVNQIIHRDAAGNITSIRMELELMAAGGTFASGLGFRLPVSKALVAGASLTVDGVPVAVPAWLDQQEATFTLAADVHALFGASNQPVNVDALVRPYVHLVFDVRLSGGPATLAGGAPFDLFIFDPSRGVEVHRPEYQGTARLQGSLIATADDNTTPGRAFVTTGGIPWALSMPEVVPYPPEGNAIDRLFPDIVPFGASAGAQNADFFRNLVPGELYPGATSPAPLQTRNPDVACFTPDPGRCGPASDVASVDAPAAGLCDFGQATQPASTGALWEWVCTGYYSQPTACDAPDLVCAPFTQRGCSANNGTGVETCNGSGSGYDVCALSACDAGFYLSGATCLPQVCSPGATQACAITNGTGTQICNMTGSGYGGCALASCDAGFAPVGQTCVASQSCVDGIQNGNETGVDCGGPDCNPCNLSMQVLDARDVTYSGIAYKVLKVRYTSDTSGTENWCREYEELCGSLGFGWRPTGCGPQWSSGGYLQCQTEYNSFVTDNSLSCNASGAVSAAARQAGYSDATGSNSFAFHSCSAGSGACSKVMCSGTYCNSALSYFDYSNPHGYTLCRRDCSSGLCPSCTDGVQNQNESDVDCGGPNCGRCADTRTCGAGSDCTSGVCSGGHCAAPTCSDGVQNGAESGVDCGGACGQCPNGFEILDQRSVTYSGIPYRVLKVRYRSANAASGNWCLDYQHLCESLGTGWSPTGCGTYFASYQGYNTCMTTYRSYVTDDSLGCNASGGVRAAAALAGYADATTWNSFAFHYCGSSGSNNCGPTMCSGQYCNSGLSYFDLSQPHGYTLCRQR